MKKIFKYNLLIVFLLIIFATPVLSALNRTSVSEIENRTLAPRPQYSRETLFNGEYFNGWEEYLSDHIYGRDEMIKSYTLLNKNILGKKRLNNIVIGRENTLLPFYTEDLTNNLNNNLNNLPIMVEKLNELDSQIKTYGGNFIFVGVPGQSSFFRDRYPTYFLNREDYFTKNESQMFESLKENNINYINMNEVFNKNPDDEYYLKTDHHFSFKGAYKTYKEIINSIKDKGVNIREALELDELDIINLEEPLLGSRNRQIYYLQPTDEKISIAYPKEGIDYTKVTDGVTDNTLYYLPEEGSPPSYSVYMGGDHGEVVINTNREELPNILIFGDSFTNALEPLLYYHFNETRILDLRHYKGMNLHEYIDLYQPDVVIMVRDDLNYGNLDGNGSF